MRSACIERALSLPMDYRRSADRKITKNLIESEVFQQAETLLCYAGTEREIDTRGIFEAAWHSGKRLCLPVCKERFQMEARAIYGMHDLEIGKYAILTPKKSCSLVQPSEIDLVVVPGCTGNVYGERLGYGAGYYDRFLEQTNAQTVYLCREKQICDPIPMEEHDVLMDWFVTEHDMIRCRHR